MELPTIFDAEDYRTIDGILDAWSKKHGVKFDTEYKSYSVRSIWIDQKLQFWIDAPDVEGYVRVHLAELKPSLPSKWGRSINWRTSHEELSDSLDQVWNFGQRWLA